MNDVRENLAATAFNVERSPRYRLAALSRLWTVSTEKIYVARFGISLAEWRILAIVGTERRTNASSIAERGLLEKSRISRMVARMIEQRLIVDEPDVRDARKVWLELTATGRAIFEAISEISIARDDMFLAPLSQRERAVLGSLLDKLLAAAPSAKG